MFFLPIYFALQSPLQYSEVTESESPLTNPG